MQPRLQDHGNRAHTAADTPRALRYGAAGYSVQAARGTLRATSCVAPIAALPANTHSRYVGTRLASGAARQGVRALCRRAQTLKIRLQLIARGPASAAPLAANTLPMRRDSSVTSSGPIPQRCTLYPNIAKQADDAVRRQARSGRAG